MPQSLAMFSNSSASSYYSSAYSTLYDVNYFRVQLWFLMLRYLGIMPSVVMVLNATFSSYDANGSISSYGIKWCNF